MAERMEPSPYYEARPHAEFNFPNETVQAGEKWLKHVIDTRDIKFITGMAGAPGFYQGLNEAVESKVEQVLGVCTEGLAGCRMEIDATSAYGCNLSVELNCGAIRGEHEDEVDAKAAKCAGHYEKCQSALGEWLTAAEATIDEANAKIVEAQVEIRTQQDRIGDLT